jgi:protein tyrosine/serine phosphatase
VRSAEIDPGEFRRLSLEGPVNFRDLGGYPTVTGRTVRRRHLFRSDALHRLTERDAARVRALGVTTLVDFRTPRERERAGPGGIAYLDDVEHVHLPTIDETRRDPEEIARSFATAADAYLTMLERGAGAYASALRIVAASEQPVVFFCSAGKDRTGVFAALVLGLLGVADEDIVTDYALTAEVIERIHVFRSAEHPELSEYAHLIGDDLRNAYPASMQLTLERVRERWGGWDEYARAIGLESRVVTMLRDRLLVD